MEKELDVVHVLRHYRHDWLNKIQLIKGYLDLSRVEKAEQYIQEIIQQARNETDLSNLKMNQVATRLLTFNWKDHPYVLTFDVLCNDDEKDWQKHENIILEILNKNFAILDTFAKWGEENELHLTFKEISNFELEIDYHGQVINKEKLVEKITFLQSIYKQYIKKVDFDEEGYYMVAVF